MQVKVPCFFSLVSCCQDSKVDQQIAKCLELGQHEDIVAHGNQSHLVQDPVGNPSRHGSGYTGLHSKACAGDQRCHVCAAQTLSCAKM